MQVNSRMKRVTDPLDDKVKARIIGHEQHEVGYLSSGSEHSACSFADLVFGMPDDVITGDHELFENEQSDSDEIMMYDSMDAVIEHVCYRDQDLFRNILLNTITNALEMFSSLKSNKMMLRRNVMAYLRDSGYNAAICKTKWETSGGLTAGNYEFIDVIRLDSASTRYFIDLDFAGEFEIARPTSRYERLLLSLPKVFVGKSEELKQILRLMSDAARRSLKSKDLHIPPWRKHRFMQNKWLGAYKRTTNVVPMANSPALLQSSQRNTVKCRSVGFHNAVVNGGLCFPAATRTR